MHEREKLKFIIVFHAYCGTGRLEPHLVSSFQTLLHDLTQLEQRDLQFGIFCECLSDLDHLFLERVEVRHGRSRRRRNAHSCVYAPGNCRRYSNRRAQQTPGTARLGGNDDTSRQARTALAVIRQALDAHVVQCFRVARPGDVLAYHVVPFRMTLGNR